MGKVTKTGVITYRFVEKSGNGVFILYSWTSMVLNMRCNRLKNKTVYNSSPCKEKSEKNEDPVLRFFNHGFFIKELPIFCPLSSEIHVLD